MRAVAGIPIVRPGDDLGRLVADALSDHGLASGDVVVVASKLLSRAEGAFVDLGKVEPSERAIALAKAVDKDPRLVQVILDDSAHVSRSAPKVLITRHRLGHVSANAGIDTSNARPADVAPGEWVLRLPSDPDATARAIRATLEATFSVSVGVVITDSLGRPFRNGSLGHTLGLAGLPALSDERGATDVFGYTLQHTFAAVADMVAAAADLVMGQGGEARGAAVVRGLCFEPDPTASSEQLRRPADRDLYA